MQYDKNVLPHCTDCGAHGMRGVKMTPLHPVPHKRNHHRGFLKKSRPGFLLIELTLGMTLFVLFLGAFAITMVEGQIGGQTAGNRIRGSEQARRAVEAAYNIRDDAFSLLKTGTHGTKINPLTGRWTLSGSQVLGSGGYTTTLTVASVDSDTKFIATKATWQITPTRAGEIDISGFVTNWRKTRTVGKWSTLTLTGSYVDGGNPYFNALVVSDGYAYAGGDIASGGRGLYVFDVRTPSSPSFISNGFTLSVDGYAVAVRGKTLYVLTGDAAAELKAYDITTPATPVLLTTKNLPGSGLARSLNVYGKYLLVGATTLGGFAYEPTSAPPLQARGWAEWLLPHTHAATYCYDVNGATMACSSSSVSSTASSSSEASIPVTDDFFVFDISSPSQIFFLGSLNVTGVNSIALSGTSAYLASDHPTSELRVVNMNNPKVPKFATGTVGGAPQGGYNLSDRNTLRATAVATTATAALLGTQYSSLIQELIGFNIKAKGIPPAAPAPLYYTTSGTIVGIAADPTRCYGFVATKRKDTALQVVKITDSTLSAMTTYNIPAPGNFGARGVYYDPVRDLLYLYNRKGIYILSPAAGANDCGT